MKIEGMDSPGAQGPRRFGRYVLIDRLGTGGMAEVFRAVMPGVEGFRRDLVIKQIRPDQSHTRNFIEMFAHEARISALLHHPNIVQVFDFGQVDGCYFLAMELLRGRDLLAVMRALRERRMLFPVPIVAHIGQQVALGLAYAHSMHSPDNLPLEILHRDVSPTNIMCLSTGGVKLLDFGIASALGEVDVSESEDSTFKGKLSYMAPERLRAGGGGGSHVPGDRADAKLDGRIDLFSLGTVLWEALVGKRLFQAKTDADKLRAILEKPIPPPSSLRPDVPARLDEIVMKALERDPDKRYLTGQALAEDLEQVALDTKYQSRMLPALLVELFGLGGSGSHLAISHLAPELLSVSPVFSSLPAAPVSDPAMPFAAGTIGPPSTVAAGLESLVPAPPGPVSRGKPSHDRGSSRQRRAVTLAMAMASALLLGGLVVAAARARSSTAVEAPGPAHPPSQPPPGTAAAAPNASFAEVSEPAPSRMSAQSPADPGGANAAITLPPTSPAGSAEPRRAAATIPVARIAPTARPSSRPKAGRVTKGLSIDPFAEAVSRRTARSP